MSEVPVLMYHALEDADHPAGARDPGEQRYVLQVSQFAEQMEYLSRQGYRTILLEELHALAQWPKRSVVLTFDDGHESNVTLALPILQRYGFKAHFFITTGWIGTPYYMNEEHIRGLRRAGMGIGAHGVTHRFLSDLSHSEMAGELAESKLALERITGREVSAMSYPGGRMSRSAIAHARSIGYGCLCSSLPRRYQKHSPPTEIPRFPLTADATVATFGALLHGRTALYDTLRYRGLALAKSLLGNGLYDRLRTYVFAAGDGSLRWRP